MKNEQYKDLVKKIVPTEDKIKNALTAFLAGGMVGVLSAAIYALFIYFGFDSSSSTGYTLIILILASSILTGLGFFDTLVEKLKCGLIIPITGFAHSMTSVAIDNKRDGLIAGIGSSIFKLAGSVLLYGIFSAFILVLLKVILYG